MEKRSETFGRLLKAGMAGIGYLEGKTQQVIEEDLGDSIGVAGVTVQRYKAGYLPPEPQSVELLAEACVRRGLLGRVWLERFLDAARQPSYAKRVLVARLIPDPTPALPSTVRPNLPPPTYTRFVMRHEAYQAVMSSLHSALPVTVIVSLGGMGKTSLARAVAGDCIERHDVTPHFAAVVWVSDKDRPGTTNLSITLDEIARVLDYPGVAALPFAERQREIDQLLRRQSVLLVLDNAETITDDALFAWLGRLPEPSRALVTSRFVLPAISNACLIELGPMVPNEIRGLIAEWLPRSRFRTMPGVLEQILPIATIVGGNAKALELALGLLQHRSLDDVLADLSTGQSDLFDDLFTRAWELLDAAAHSVMYALLLFPVSAATDALAYCADLSAAAFQRSVDQLVVLSLLDSERLDVRTAPRYNMHPLVRTFIQAQFAQLPDVTQAHLRTRWLAWCVDIAVSVGFCWDDLDRLDILDREYETIQAAVVWAAEHAQGDVVITLVEGVRYFYNVRGLWGEEELHNHERRAAAAVRLGDRDNEVIALAHHVQVLSKQGRIEEATSQLGHLLKAYASGQRMKRAAQAADECNTLSKLNDDAAFEYLHAQALYARARRDLESAEARWRELLALSHRMGGQQYVVNRRWLATVLLEQGRVLAARQLYAESLHDAQQINDTRSVVGNTLKIALIDLTNDNLPAAIMALEQCRNTIIRYKDRRRLAESHWIAAQILSSQHDHGAAVAEFEIALDLFKRLGMRHEASQAERFIDTLVSSALV